MITTWFYSVFELLSINVLDYYTIFGISISFDTLILLNFLLLITFFIFEIFLGLTHLCKKLYTF